jgi:hypothetical protein
MEGSGEAPMFRAEKIQRMGSELKEQTSPLAV